MYPQTVTETFLRSRNRIASGVILYFISPTSFTSIISVKKNLLIREHHKGPFAIGGPVMNSLSPPHVIPCFFSYEP